MKSAVSEDLPGPRSCPGAHWFLLGGWLQLLCPSHNEETEVIEPAFARARAEADPGLCPSVTLGLQGFKGSC